jgi:uncharacterized protein
LTYALGRSYRHGMGRLNRGQRHTLRFLFAIAMVALFTVGCRSTQHAVPKAAQEQGYDWSDRSYYLAMRDGTRLALSLYFPHHVVPAKPAPVLLIQTRYGRATALPQAKPWLDAGYGVAIVDVRGTTSSFGYRDSEVGPDEQRDMEEIIGHLAQQPWSSGKVIAAGRSYLADTADMATTRHAPALVASIPRETDFDFYDLFWPGGIPNKYLFIGWGDLVILEDFGREPAGPNLDTDVMQNALDCRARLDDCPKLFPMLQPVDEDSDYRLLREALNTRESERRHWTTQDYANALFRDDKGLNGYPIFEGSAGDHLAAVRREKVPVQYWGSWVDANTADAALNRYRSTPEVPSAMIITGNNHHGDICGDPFFPNQRDPVPTVAQQDHLNVAFSDQILAGQIPMRTIEYYVMGARVMRETPLWPPAGIEQVRYFLDAHGGLTRARPATGVDSRAVDFTATTGKGNRWTTQIGAAPAYTDRLDEDRKLMTWDTPPVSEDREMAGWPVVTLRMRTKTSDPAVFAYIEDVAPDGRVTYITEGEIRAVNRKIADSATLPYNQGPAPHSFNRADALPVVPGEAFTLEFKLYSTAALIRKGHRVRLAIAGADADTFARLSNGQSESFDILRGGAEPSSVQLPLRAWH